MCIWPPSVIDSGRRGWTCGDLSTSKPRPFIRPAPLHKLVCDLFRPLVRFVAVISLLSFRFSFCLFLLFDCLSRVGFLFLTHFPRLRFKTRKRKTFVTAVPESFKLLFFFSFFCFCFFFFFFLFSTIFPLFFFHVFRLFDGRAGLSADPRWNPSAPFIRVHCVTIT